VKTRSKIYAAVCAASLLLCAASCSDDDENMMGSQQVSSSQAESILAGVIPTVLDFSLSIVTLVQATAPLPPVAGKAVQGTTCTPIPGVETQYLCADPNTGVACPVSATTTEWQFTNCDADGTTVNGTVTVEGAGPFVLTFNLTLDGSSAMGQMTITFGTSCDSIDYDQLILTDSGVSANLLGTLQSCSGVPGGEITATINAPGVQTFVAQMSVGPGVLYVTVLDGQTQDPLYLCGCTIDLQNPDNVTCSCEPYVPGGANSEGGRTSLSIGSQRD